MSIDVRHVTNGVKSGYYVRNSGVTPMTVDFYSKKEEIPESIRHYAPDGEPKYWGRIWQGLWGVRNYCIRISRSHVDIRIIKEKHVLLKVASMRQMMIGNSARILGRHK